MKKITILLDDFDYNELMEDIRKRYYCLVAVKMEELKKKEKLTVEEVTIETHPNQNGP